MDIRHGCALRFKAAGLFEEAWCSRHSPSVSHLQTAQSALSSNERLSVCRYLNDTEQRSWCKSTWNTYSLCFHISLKLSPIMDYWLLKNVWCFFGLLSTPPTPTPVLNVINNVILNKRRLLARSKVQGWSISDILYLRSNQLLFF